MKARKAFLITCLALGTTKGNGGVCFEESASKAKYVSCSHAIDAGYADSKITDFRAHRAPRYDVLLGVKGPPATGKCWGVDYVEAMVQASGLASPPVPAADALDAIAKDIPTTPPARGKAEKQSPDSGELTCPSIDVIRDRLNARVAAKQRARITGEDPNA